MEIAEGRVYKKKKLATTVTGLETGVLGLSDRCA
jgi:hypothetical protein